MQFDQAWIAIRERTWVDNLDLALHVIRDRFAPLVASALVGIVPCAVIIYLVLAWSHTPSYPDSMNGPAFVLSTLLVMWLAPLATAPLTLYLGQAMFQEKPAARQIAREFWACLPQLVLLQFLFRALLIFPIVSWIVPYAVWPYLNEVILLERNPLRGRQGQVSTLKRNGNLHRNNNGEFLVRALATLVLAPLLIVAIWISQRYLLETLFGYHAPWGVQAAAFQAVLWLVVTYFTVARFLSYIDQRIRTEGWEVELFLRVESARLSRHLA